MAIDPDHIRALRFETKQSLMVRDTILYALGVGAGQTAPTDPKELAFVYEEGLKTLPTMAAVMAYPGFWLKDPELGADWTRVLHGEQSIRLHGPLPVEGELVGETRIDGLFDKGEDKGALMVSTRTIRDGSGRMLAEVSQTTMLRGDGGFGGSAEGAPVPHALPQDRAADHIVEVGTRPDQALLYRLSGDWNPLHADPVVASRGGFPAPILHGLCTYGVAGRALLAHLCDRQPERLRRLDVRFSSPVYPGEALRLEIWNEGKGQAAFRARAIERDVVVLQNGLVRFDA